MPAMIYSESSSTPVLQYSSTPVLHVEGSWGSYYWNGPIFTSELDRGMDILELTPSPLLSANEIAAAKLVRFDA
jgi:hypothetical protein